MTASAPRIITALTSFRIAPLDADERPIESWCSIPYSAARCDFGRPPSFPNCAGSAAKLASLLIATGLALTAQRRPIYSEPLSIEALVFSSR